MEKKIIAVTVVLCGLFPIGFGPLGIYLGSLNEEFQLGLLILIFFSILVSTVLFGKKCSLALTSVLISIASVGVFSTYIYWLGISVGNQSAGFVEGKGLAVGIGVLALTCLSVLLVSLGVGVAAYFRKESGEIKGGVAFGVSLTGMLIICVPIVVLLLPPQLGLGIQRWSWIAQVYRIADWSREINNR